MEYLKTISIPAHNVALYGKAVGDMVERGMRVREDGTVKGKFHYVNGYYGFNKSKPEEQEGYYFPFLLNVTGEKMDFIKNGKPGKTGLDFEPYNVFRVTAEDTFEVKVDGKTVASFDFSQAVFEQKKGEHKMFTDFFDTGVCGIPQTAHVGTITKDTEQATDGVVLDKEIPAGFRLVNIVAFASSDEAGATTVTIGDGTTDNAYVDGGSVTKGKGLTTDLALATPVDGKVKVKVDSAVTTGSIDIFVTAVKLGV